MERSGTRTATALLCFDGSPNAVNAITLAGDLLRDRSAIVLTVWEPVAMWAPYDPATVLTARVSRFATKELHLDEITRELATATMEEGLKVARAAGFDATGRIAEGKAWREICRAAAEVEAVPLVLGARGMSRVASTLLGSVSAAVAAHTKHPILIVPPPASAGHDGSRPL